MSKLHDILLILLQGESERFIDKFIKEAEGSLWYVPCDELKEAAMRSGHYQQIQSMIQDIKEERL